MMRISKKLLVFLFVASIFTSCKDDDNTSFALQDISAPTNLSAVFDISQDDTGTVTITPTAVGASSFDVFFGDVEGETATAVSPGETISKVYGEGEFNLRIVAVGTTGLTSELVRVVTISFTPPTDLTATVAISETNPFEVNVTPVAANATVFDVFFGLGADEVPVTIMSGETATYMYAEAGEYEVRVVARGAGSATIELTDTITVTGNAAPIVLPITFDDATVNYAFSTFNGASYEVVDNPDVAGANAEESKVGAITNSGAQFEGGAFTLGTPIDFSGTNKTVSMKFWSTSALPVLLKFEGGVNDERQTEVVAQHGGTGWEILTFDFATDAIKSFIDGNQGVGEAFVPDGQYATIVLFVDGPGTTAGTFYLDDVAQASGESTAPQFPLDFESDTIEYAWLGFGAADFTEIPSGVIANPDATGINTSSNVTFITKPSGSQTWAGAGMPLDGAIDFSSSSIVTLKVWSPRAGTPILFKIEDTNSELDNNGNPTVFVEISATSTTASAWELLTYDLSSIDTFSSSITYNKVVLFPDFGTAGDDETFYFDDLVVGNSSSSATEPATAAPTPTESAANVISLFSDVFADVTVDTWRTDWSDATLEDVTVAGDAVKKYSALSFVGIETVASQIDASSMTHFRTDIWTADATEFKIKLVDFGPDGAFDGGDDTEHEITIASPAQGEWVSLDIPLSDFTGLTTTSNIAQLIYVGSPSQANTVFIDNVYFYTSSTSSATEPATAAPTPTESAANVISLFSDVFADVTVDTWRTDWSDATLEDVTVAGDAVKKYSALSFVGIETVASQIDASSMTHFRTDIWTADATEFKIKLVDFGPDGAFDGGDDTEHEITISSPAQGEWVSLDIPLSDFTGLTTTSNIAQLIYVGSPSQANTVFVDNVYFYTSSTSSATEPATAAPTPTESAANVISLFSDAYADVTVDTWRTDWSDATLEDVTVAGDAVKKYSALSFVGIETVSSTIDASSMTHFRTDIWTADATEFKIKLVDFGPDGAFDGGDDTEHEITIASPAQGQWVSLDIPLSDFTGLTTTSNIAQLIYVGSPSQANTVFVDNVYFRN